MKSKLDLITVRQASMVGNRDSSDSVIVLNDKKFRVKAEFVNDFADGNILLRKTIYRQSNFLIIDEQIYHRNDYLETGTILNNWDEIGLIVYFLVPYTREDWVEIPVIEDFCYLDGSFEFLDDIIVEVPVGIVVNLDNEVLDLETVSWEFNFLQSTTMLNPYEFTPHATNHLKGVVTFNQPGPWEIIYHADGCRLVLELNV